MSLILAPMIAAKVPHAVIMQTVLAFEAQQTDALEKRREADRNRQNRHRNGPVTLHNVTRSPSRSHAGVEGSSSKQEISGQPRKTTDREARSDFESEFEGKLSPEQIAALVDIRQAKRAAITGHTARLLLTKMQACGVSMSDAADAMALRNWTSIEPGWLPSSGSASARAPPKPKTVGEMFREDAKREGLIDDHPPPENLPRRLDPCDASREKEGSGGARIIALTGNILGRIG